MRDREGHHPLPRRLIEATSGILGQRASRLWVRLASGFGTLLALMALVVVLAIIQFRTLARNSEQMMRRDLQRMLQVQQIDEHVQGHGSAMARLLTSARPEREGVYRVVDAEYAAIEGLITTLATDSPDLEAARRLRLVAEQSTRYREAFIEVVTEIEAEDLVHASALFNGIGQAAMKSLLEATQAMLDHETTLLADRQQAVKTQIGHSEWLLASLAAVALLLSVLLAWQTTASVAKPLARVEAAAHRIADGDYSARVDVRGGDELSGVARAMNTLAAAVAARETQIENVAYRDQLTGLPNRAMLRRLAANAPAGELSAVLVDVARLRAVNEVLGFETGDALLVRIAARLRAATEPADMAPEVCVLARMPGGVFALLCRSMARSEIEALCARVDAMVSVSMECDGNSIDVHLVFGLAEARGSNAPIDALLRHAELAVGEAKRGRRKSAWHVPVDDAARVGQLSLLSSLHGAAANGELEMWLQPKQCLRSGKTLGMEGLVRWRHPVRGLVPPAEFIPYAERTGHIGVVTHAMLNAALSRLATWAKIAPSLSIAINVSALDIRDTAFAERVDQIARRHGAPLDRLRLEITESCVMEEADRVLPVLHALRALGVQLSIDDFGTGYSSLAYLQRLPVSELKIDRAFVSCADRDTSARALLRTIIELGHSLGMCVTAEGIERAEEHALLVELGCDVAQGYLVGRPLDPQAATDFVNAAFDRRAELA